MTFLNTDNFLFKKKVEIPQQTEVIFVSDNFIEDYPNGGAELTTQALLDSSPLKVFKIKSKEVTMELLEKGFTKYWIFGNFSQLNFDLIPSICANLQYSIIEYDYKYCKYRSPEKHEYAEGKECDCKTSNHGLLVSAFFHAAKSLWWMSVKQKEYYESMFPFLRDKVESTVLSSVFDDKTFFLLKTLRENVEERTDKYIVLNSPSWIKGKDDCVKYCEDNSLEYELVWNLRYDELLTKLASSKGLVFLPKGSDTCPRLVIEAKLLGCDIILNDNVQHHDELWFDTKDLTEIESYLYLCRDRFWNGIIADMNFSPSISGYTTTKDCIKQGYPFEESIKSMLGFCDEVVVVDGGSDDGTWEKLEELSKDDNRIVIHQQTRNWNEKRFAVFDGLQKALARSICSSDFCWQQDSDEIVHENDYDKIKNLVRYFPKDVPLLALPVIEYWGGKDKVRMDITMWKWRLSRNLPQITHGIPMELRRFDEDGKLYSEMGSDGCNYVNSSDYRAIPCMNFYTNEIEGIRRKAMAGDSTSLLQFQNWFNTAVSELPSVHHFSWFNIERKIHTYKNYWSKHWESLYDVKQDDSAENNMFFNKKWSNVTNDDIKELSSKLANDMGGWIFHSRVDFNKKTPHITIQNDVPEVIKDWIEKN